MTQQWTPLNTNSSSMLMKRKDERPEKNGAGGVRPRGLPFNVTLTGPDRDLADLAFDWG